MSDAESLGPSGWSFFLTRAARLSRVLRDRLRHPGNVRALLLYASMPGLSAVNAAVGLWLPALLGPAEFGHYAIAVTLFQYGLILDLGMSQLIDRRLPVLLTTNTPDRLQEFANRVLWVRLYVAAAASLVGMASLVAIDSAGRLPFPLLPGVLSLLAGLGFMVALGPLAVWRATARRSEFARWSAACNTILAVGRPLGILLGGLAGCFGLLAALYAVLAARLQAAMPLHVADCPSPRLAGSLLAQGAPLFATSFIWAFYMTANRWVVSSVATPVELGQFAFGANMLYLIVGTVGALAQLHYPDVVSRAALGGNFAVSRVLARNLCGLALLVALPAAVGIAVGPWLINLFYHTFSGAELPMRHLLVAVPILVVASWLMPLSLSTTARPWREGVLIYPVALVLLMLGTWGGFRVGGIGGAAWGSSGSAVVLVLLQLGNLRLISLMSLADAARVLLVAGAATVGLAAIALLP